MTPTQRAVAEALWRHVDEDFSADKAHQAFIGHCQQHGDLAFAAQHYRRRLSSAQASRPNEAEHIERRLKSIASLSLAGLNSQPPQALPGQGLKRAITVVAALFFLAAVAVLLVALRR